MSIFNRNSKISLETILPNIWQKQRNCRIRSKVTTKSMRWILCKAIIFNIKIINTKESYDILLYCIFYLNKRIKIKFIIF
jgi:hypothetical protein